MVDKVDHSHSHTRVGDMHRKVMESTSANYLDLNSTDLQALFGDLYDNMTFYNCSFGNFCDNTTVLNYTNTTEIPQNDTEPAGPRILPHPLWLTVILAALAGIVCIVTVCGNILVVLSFFLERSIRQPTNYFIASLAVSDLLIGTFSMPCFTIYLLLGYWPLGEIICDLWLSLDWTVCLASQYTVFFITADRFFSVKIPAKYRNWRTERKVRWMIALCWTIPTVVFFTSIVGWQYFVGERTVDPEFCEVQFMKNPLFTFLLTIGYYWTTLIVMCGLYAGIYRVALKLQKKTEAKHKKMQRAMEMSHEQKQSKKKDGSAGGKASRKRVENNNARFLRSTVPTDNTVTTSFSRISDENYSKPSEEDRSSSPAFASDEDEGSSNEHCKGGEKVKGYVNSAVQTEGSSLRGMLGSSFNHVSKIAFSISGTSVGQTGSIVHSLSEKDDSEDHHGSDPQRPLLAEANKSFKPIQVDPPKYSNVVTSETQADNKQHATKVLENDVLDGFKYIDEESLKSLTSSENMKLLAETNEKRGNLQPNESTSPVWKKRLPDNDRSLLVSASVESNISAEMIDVKADQEGASGFGTTENKGLSGDSKFGDGNRNSTGIYPELKPEGAHPHHHHHHHHHHHSSNDSRKSKNKHKPNKPFGSPLQSLVQSIRQTQNRIKKEKKIKSKSENRARKALRTITFILGAYVLCWTPYHVMVFIIGVCGDWTCINLQLYYFTYWLCYLNSPVNPFCYALANAQFKRTFVRILKRDFHRT